MSTRFYTAILGRTRSYPNRSPGRIIRGMKRSALITLLCVWLAFAGSAIVSRTVFDRLPHLEDEFAFLFQARIFERGQTYIETPEPARAYWQPFLINKDGKRFGKYPPGWPALLAVGTALDQPWIVNAWLMMLTVAITYRLGRALYSPETGALAALLVTSSPMGLLLAGTLMNHTAGLFFTLLFVYAMWRLEQRGRAVWWGAVGGVALGMLIATRPLTAAGVAAPFVLYSAGRVLWAALRARAGLKHVLAPLVVLSAVTVGIGLSWPAFNYSVSAPPGESFPAYLVRFARGDKDTNLYRYIWDYDRVGFGPGYGRFGNGHTLESGWKIAASIRRCAMRDLFGWATPPEDGMTVEEDACLFTTPGYSWVLLPVGLLLTARRRWTWLLAALVLSVMGAYLAYWIGSYIYSARYYSEAIGAAALLSAAAVTALVRWIDAPAIKSGGLRPGGVLYLVIAAVALYSLVIYTPARLKPLRGYGQISQSQLVALDDVRRDPSRPVLVIAVGEHYWRDVATLMGVTSPFRDSEIVLARDPDGDLQERLRAEWSDREVIYLVNGHFTHDLSAAHLD